MTEQQEYNAWLEEVRIEREEKMAAMDRYTEEHFRAEAKALRQQLKEKFADGELLTTDDYIAAQYYGVVDFLN